MRLTSRILVALLILGTGAGVHSALTCHLEAIGPLTPVPLRQPLARLPMRFGVWSGVEIPPRSVFADEHITRVYRNALTGQEMTVNLSYSAHAEDRKHDPLLCLGVFGYQEEPQARELISVPGHASPVQGFRLHKSGETILAFYWHYTLTPKFAPESSRVQRLYQRLRGLPSSVSIAAFTQHYSDEDRKNAHEFIRLLDAALQSHVGPDAVRGISRASIMLVGQDGLRTGKW